MIYCAGIGKGLTKQYDLTKIAQPFLKELIDLKDGSAAASAAKSLTKKLGWRKQDLAAVVTQPRKVDYIAGVLKQIENGDLRVRSRVLESERFAPRHAHHSIAILLSPPCRVVFLTVFGAFLLNIFTRNLFSPKCEFSSLQVVQETTARSGEPRLWHSCVHLFERSSSIECDSGEIRCCVPNDVADGAPDWCPSHHRVCQAPTAG